MTPLKLFVLATVLFAPAAMAQQGAPKPGHYCLRTDLGGGDDDEPPLAQSLNKLDDARLPGQRSRLGFFGVDVDIAEQDGKTLVGFSNFMPDNGQIVRTDPVPATRGADGRLEFAFTDNWKAPGKGVVTAEGPNVVLSVSRTKEAETFAGQYAARQFGEYKLKPGTCPAYSGAR